ncbi:MAG: hypothetical protein LBN18_02375 [Dysgonamonadaceae bacterium]|jgi:hypothetical protein|nr:hypothetical protein [Dysgonamonadaceae bacterium]
MNKWILKSQIRKQLKNNSIEHRYLNMKDIGTILILFDTENYGEVDAFVKQLKRMGKKVTAYAFKEKKDTGDYSGSPFQIVTDKEAYDWFKNHLKTLAEEMKKTHQDALFDLTIRENLALEYLCANADASIKVGFKKNNYPLYDLSFSALNVKDNHENLKVRELGRQMIHYLSTIR